VIGQRSEQLPLALRLPLAQPLVAQIQVLEFDLHRPATLPEARSRLSVPKGGVLIFPQ
jgi:hypothetical protein